MTDNEIMCNLQWVGNSKQMYRAIIDAVPSFFSGAVKKSIVNWIRKNDITVVTEDLVYEAVRSMAPESIYKMIIPRLDMLREDSDNRE